jgi:hypothetical protein
VESGEVSREKAVAGCEDSREWKRIHGTSRAINIARRGSHMLSGTCGAGHAGQGRK